MLCWVEHNGKYLQLEVDEVALEVSQVSKQTADDYTNGRRKSAVRVCVCLTVCSFAANLELEQDVITTPRYLVR